VLGKAEVTRPAVASTTSSARPRPTSPAARASRSPATTLDDARFLEKVVARGGFALDRLHPGPTTRPLQTIKKVIAGEAECALIDDAQFAELAKIEGGAGIKSVWKSDKLPPMVVVAFPSAPAAERSAFQASLGKVCSGEGKAACGEVGIKSLGLAGATDYQAVIAAYSR
jgi:hypothetical protein